MSVLFGNICLVIAALTSSALITTVFRYKPPHGGSGGVAGYPILMLLFHAVFLLVMALAFIAIARKGGFDWISANKFLRYALVTIGLLAVVFTSFSNTMVLERPMSASAFMRAFSQYALVLIPVILVVTGFILLNTSLRQSIPSILYTLPLIMVFCAGLFGAGTAIVDEISRSSKSVTQRHMEYENSESIQSNHFREIEEAEIRQNFIRILELTGPDYAQAVREKASAKIRTHPSWQNELILLVEDDRARQVFGFLSLNDVEDKAVFLEPINTGILSVASWIRASVQSALPKDYHHEMFFNDVSVVLTTVEKFDGMGKDYLPAMRELRAALDEPIPGKKTRYACIPSLESWIAKHQ